MEIDTVRLVREVLPRGKTLYFDFADRYAVILLQQWIGGERASIADIKKSHLATQWYIHDFT